jgi:type VI protein secretion system component VasK
MNEFFNDVQQFASDNATWLWVALGVLIALVVLGALLAVWRSKKRSWDRKHATQLRREADERAVKIDEHDAETRRLEAEAEQARAEADRLEAIAAEKRGAVEHERKEYVARLDEADKLDHGRRKDREHERGYKGEHAKH